MRLKVKQRRRFWHYRKWRWWKLSLSVWAAVNTHDEGPDQPFLRMWWGFAICGVEYEFTY